MARKKVSNEVEARQELGSERTRPTWLERQHALPFNNLSPDEFEILSYLLLRQENSDATVYYYGKTGDGGRDIFIEKTNGSKELIQCKLYSNNVGLAEIKEEIAKLYSNIFHKKIPIKPTTITFFVVPDITAPAQDFINSILNNRHKWLNDLEEAFKKYLKVNTIDKKLLDFAEQWNPNINKQTALDLTQRVQSFPALIEEFFAIKKVMDASAIVPMENKLDQILHLLNNQHSMLISPTLDNVSSTLQKIINDYEEKNPYLTFQVIANSETTRIVIVAKQNISLGTLIFEDSITGNRGKEKFLLMVNEGRSIELFPNEYKWVWDNNISLPDMSGSLHINPMIPDKTVPIKIILIKNNDELFSIDFASSKIVRLGEHETEVKINSIYLPCEVGMIFNNVNKSVRIFNINKLDLHNVLVDQAINFYQLISLINQGAFLKFYSLEFKEELLLGGGKSIYKSDKISEIDEILDILNKIKQINQTLNLSVQFPKTDEDWRDIDQLFDYVKTGEIKIPSGSITVISTPEKIAEADFTHLLENVITAKWDNFILSYEIQKNIIPIHFEPAFMRINSPTIENRDKLEDKLKNLSKSDEIPIELAFESAILSKHPPDYFLPSNEAI